MFVRSFLNLPGLGGGGSTSLCLDGGANVRTCGSSRRYKDDITSFSTGLKIVQKPRPVTFNWKSNGQEDLGLVAEEVNKVNRLLTTYNSKGEIEGVKYDRLTAVLVNAIKEQQQQISQQQKQIAQQQGQLESLKKLVCQSHSRAAACKGRRTTR